LPPGATRSDNRAGKRSGNDAARSSFGVLLHRRSITAGSASSQTPSEEMIRKSQRQCNLSAEPVEFFLSDLSRLAFATDKAWRFIRRNA
jgi:hypothetical protein